MAAFWLESATAFAALGLAVAMLARCASVPQAVLWRPLRPLLLLAALTVVAGAFFNGAEAAPLAAVRFSWAGLHSGALYAARLLLITLLSSLFFFTTRPNDAISLGIRLLAPLRLLGIERKELSLLVHLAYRFLPLLARELQEMRWGRKARNLPPPGNLPAIMRNAIDTLVTVVIGALHRAEITALAMEQRGLLASWKPAPLAGGAGSSAVGLWPLLVLALCTGVLLRFDRGLL